MTNKTIMDLNLEDDFLFAKVMSDQEICRKVLQEILQVPIKKVVLPTTQRTINILFEGKGIRLDVYINDDKGTVYNVEMQRGKNRELPKRSRYYAGSIDFSANKQAPHQYCTDIQYIQMLRTLAYFSVVQLL